MKMGHGLKTLLLILSFWSFSASAQKTLGVDTLRGTVTNGNITVSPNGTGDVDLNGRYSLLPTGALGTATLRDRGASATNTGVGIDGTTGTIDFLIGGVSILDLSASLFDVNVDADFSSASFSGAVDMGSTLIVGGTTPNASAAMQVDSTNQGFLPPRMTTAQRTSITTPADGLQVYDSDLDEMYVRANGAWASLQSAGGTEVKSARVVDGAASTTVSEDDGNLINGNCTNNDDGQYVCTFTTSYTNTPHCWVERVSSVEATASLTTTTTNTTIQFRQPVCSWESFTLTHTWSANTTDTSYKRQVGENIEIKAQIDINSAPTGGLNVTIPDSLVAASAALQDPEVGSAGTWSYHDNGIGRRLGGAAELLSTTTVRFNTNTNVSLDVNNPITWASGDQIGLLLDIPVTGYSQYGCGRDVNFILVCIERD